MQPSNNPEVQVPFGTLEEGPDEVVVSGYEILPTRQPTDEELAFWRDQIKHL